MRKLRGKKKRKAFDWACRRDVGADRHFSRNASASETHFRALPALLRSLERRTRIECHCQDEAGIFRATCSPPRLRSTRFRRRPHTRRKAPVNSLFVTRLFSRWTQVARSEPETGLFSRMKSRDARAPNAMQCSFGVAPRPSCASN